MGRKNYKTTQSFLKNPSRGGDPSPSSSSSFLFGSVAFSSSPFVVVASCSRPLMCGQIVVVVVVVVVVVIRVVVAVAVVVQAHRTVLLLRLWEKENCDFG